MREKSESQENYETFPARVFLACPHDLENPKFTELLTLVGWNSVVCFSTGDRNILSGLKHARNIYVVISKCIHSSPFVEMVLKTIELTDNSGCERLLLRLDETEIPPLLFMLRQLPEDTELYSEVSKTKALREREEQNW